MAKCTRTINLDVHHKRRDKGNDLSNAEVLCSICHKETSTYDTQGSTPPAFSVEVKEKAMRRAGYRCECTRTGGCHWRKYRAELLPSSRAGIVSPGFGITNKKACFFACQARFCTFFDKNRNISRIIGNILLWESLYKIERRNFFIPVWEKTII